MNKFNDYYEKITPALTAEELTERVTAKADKPKKRISARFIGIAAAAAAVLTLGVTATASELGYFDIFSNLFGEKAENLTHNIVEEAEVIRNDTEKMDFELVAAAADKHRVIAVVDVTAKNGFKLGENHIGDARADFWKDFETQSGGGGGMSLIAGDESRARVIVWTTASEDITGREVILTLGEFQLPEMIDRETDKQWQVKFTAYGESLEYEIDDVKISVSPISVCFSSENKIVGNEWNPITIITEDGSFVISSGGKSRQKHADGTYEEQLIYLINEPIDHETVIAIEVQGTRYDLK